MAEILSEQETIDKLQPIILTVLAEIQDEQTCPDSASALELINTAGYAMHTSLEYTLQKIRQDSATEDEMKMHVDYGTYIWGSSQREMLANLADAVIETPDIPSAVSAFYDKRAGVEIQESNAESEAKSVVSLSAGVAIAKEMAHRAQRNVDEIVSPRQRKQGAVMMGFLVLGMVISSGSAGEAVVAELIRQSDPVPLEVVVEMSAELPKFVDGQISLADLFRERQLINAKENAAAEELAAAQVRPATVMAVQSAVSAEQVAVPVVIEKPKQTTTTTPPKASTKIYETADKSERADIISGIRWAADQYEVSGDLLVGMAKIENDFDDPEYTPNRCNSDDSNAIAGTPSCGPMQFIETTFDSMAPNAYKANPNAWKAIGVTNQDQINWLKPKQQLLTAAYAVSVGDGDQWTSYRMLTA